MSLIQFLHIIFCIYLMYLSIFAKMIWWLLSRGLDFKIQMIPRTFLLLNSNGNNTFNRRRPKSQFFCCPHFVMISLLGIGQKSSHVCFSADFSTQTRMAWGQILTWFWRFTVGDEQGGHGTTRLQKKRREMSDVYKNTGCFLLFRPENDMRKSQNCSSQKTTKKNKV